MTFASSNLERIAVALELLVNQPQNLPRPGSGAALVPGMSSQDRGVLKELKGDLAQVKADLAEIKLLLTAQRGEVVKEAYTVEEVATKTDLAPYTIRQACNKQRIKGAYKGKDKSWRIPDASLRDILSNGLPPE